MHRSWISANVARTVEQGRPSTGSFVMIRAIHPPFEEFLRTNVLQVHSHSGYRYDELPLGLAGEVLLDAVVHQSNQSTCHNDTAICQQVRSW